MSWLKKIFGGEKQEPKKPAKVLPTRLDADRCPHCGLTPAIWIRAGSFGCGMCERKAKQGA